MSFQSINSEAPEQITRRYKGQFASLKFPRYQYQEYPKIIYDPAGAKIGRATNAMEEAEILAGAGLEVNAIDPLKALQAELAAARESLAKYEGNDPAKQIAARKPGPQTASVEMLPASAPAAEAEKQAEFAGSDGIGQAPLNASAKPNPLLKPQAPTGSPSPIGTAPKVSAPLKSGV